MKIKKLIAGLMAITIVFGAGGVLNNVSKDVITVNASAEEEKPTSGKCGENITWKLDADGTLTISGTGEMVTLNGNSIISPFYDRDDIKKVIIENGITTIGSCAFVVCENLKSITIPDSVTSIGSRAFDGCTNLTNVIIPDSVTSLGQFAFDGTAWLENQREENSMIIANKILVDGTACKGKVIIPDGVRVIADSAFNKCSDITDIIMPDSVTNIGETAFLECENLSNITIPASVTDIGSSAFGYTKWLENKQNKNPLVIVNGILVDGKACQGEVIVELSRNVQSENTQNLG